MSISGYAELMMNGMVRPENIADFSGRIYKEANRLGNLVADIIQLSRLDEQQDAVVLSLIHIYCIVLPENGQLHVHSLHRIL